MLLRMGRKEMLAVWTFSILFCFNVNGQVVKDNSEKPRREIEGAFSSI